MLGLSLERVLGCRKAFFLEREGRKRECRRLRREEYARQEVLAAEIRPIARKLGLKVAIENKCDVRGSEFKGDQRESSVKLWVKVRTGFRFGFPTGSLVVMARVPSVPDASGIFVAERYLDKEEARKYIEKILCEYPFT